MSAKEQLESMTETPCMIQGNIRYLFDCDEVYKKATTIDDEINRLKTALKYKNKLIEMLITDLSKLENKCSCGAIKK